MIVRDCCRKVFPREDLQRPGEDILASRQLYRPDPREIVLVI